MKCRWAPCGRRTAMPALDSSKSFYQRDRQIAEGMVVDNQFLRKTDG